MILVITKDGNVYINEKAVVSVIHSRKLKKALITPMGEKKELQHIDYVEQIRYISDNADVCIEEDGSEVKKLKDKLKEKDAENAARRKYTNRMRAIALDYEFTHPALFDKTIMKLKKDNPKLFEDDTPKVNPGD